MELKTEIKELKEENEKLKEANDTFTLGAKRTIERNCKLYQENIKLKEEVQKWTSWASDVLYFSHSESKSNLESKKLITALHQPTFTNIRDFGGEISKLRDEKKELTIKNIYMEEQIKELEEENEKLAQAYDDADANWRDSDEERCDSCDHTWELNNNGKLVCDCSPGPDKDDFHPDHVEIPEYCNGKCCERSPKMGSSWWKQLGFDCPCTCAYTISKRPHPDE